jgi:hypothetical protein
MAKHTNINKISVIKVPNSSGVDTYYDVHDSSAIHTSSEIVFSEETNDYKEEMMYYIANNIADYSNILTEDGKYVTTENDKRFLITNPDVTSASIEFTGVDDIRWKNPMMQYIHDNISFDSVSVDKWKNSMTEYIISYIYKNLKFDDLNQTFKTDLVKYVKAN